MGADMSETNGHRLNGAQKGGSGGPTPEGYGVRSALNTTRELAEKGRLAVAQIPQAIRMAAEIASGEGTQRDRLSAMKLLATLAKISSEAELELDRIGRLDRGEATERTETREFVVTVPRVGRLSD
jgi:hypothetical protein